MTDIGGASNLGTIFEFTPIPEPSTLLLTGTAGVLGYLYRRQRAAYFNDASRIKTVKNGIVNVCHADRLRCLLHHMPRRSGPGVRPALVGDPERIITL